MDLFHFCFLVLLSLSQSLGADTKPVATVAGIQIAASADDEYAATASASDWLAVVPFFSESVEEKDEETHTGDVADCAIFSLSKREPSSAFTNLLLSESTLAFSLSTPLFILFQVFRN